MRSPIRVLIADDRPRSRTGLRALLSLRPEVEIVGEAADGQQAVQMIEETQPDVILMDVLMPRMDGLQATQIIKSTWPELKVVIVTMNALHQSEAMAAGADSFVVKGCPSEEILTAITGEPRGQTGGERPRLAANSEGNEPRPKIMYAWCAR
ncbi:MAG: response regulator transcription factor [Anaerolineae bacterium]|jgi:DNA-binding NarL/FixJ family response regulator